MSAKADQSSSSSDEIDLLDLLLILWKRRIILGLSALTFFSLGVLLALAHTPTYKGQVQVQVHQLNEIEMAGFDAWNQGVRVANRPSAIMVSDILTGGNAPAVTFPALRQSIWPIPSTQATSGAMRSWPPCANIRQLFRILMETRKNLTSC